MRKKLISKNIFDKKYSAKELTQHINNQVDNVKFDEHCQQVSKNLNVDVVVVKELLLHNSFIVLSLLQKSILQDKIIKINITGYFSFLTTLIKYKISHLRAITKGRTY